MDDPSACTKEERSEESELSAARKAEDALVDAGSLRANVAEKPDLVKETGDDRRPLAEEAGAPPSERDGDRIEVELHRERVPREFPVSEKAEEDPCVVGKDATIESSG